MANHARALHLICGKEETLQEAKVILGIARAKTGPGSGHSLGKNTNALPAICAFLASQQLANNDVTERVAQQSACLNPKDFAAALSAVRGALVSYFEERKRTGVSYELLCKNHGLGADEMYWMEQADKKTRASEELKEYDVDDELIICAVFYWTCIALNMRRSLNSNELIRKYGIPRRTFDDVLELLDVECKSLTLKIDKFLNENTGTSTPRNKRYGSPTKTPSRSVAHADDLEASPTKRRTVLPPLPFMTPKKKIISPVKLNRIPVGAYSSTSTPSRVRIGASSIITPARTPSTQRSFLHRPDNRVDSLVQQSHEDEAHGGDVEPFTPSKKRVILETEVTADQFGEDSNSEASSTVPTPSPHKSLRRKATSDADVTPMMKRTRMRGMSPIPSRKKTPREKAQAVDEKMDSNPNEDDVVRQQPCRHCVPVFADRAFYQNRDPRVLREWEACEKLMKEFGVSYAQISMV